MSFPCQKPRRRARSDPRERHSPQCQPQSGNARESHAGVAAGAADGPACVRPRYSIGVPAQNGVRRHGPADPTIILNREAPNRAAARTAPATAPQSR
jgi:hypothetical protein